ncbi:primosomal protein N' [Dehalococcoidia bacterium]|nr:primosomal protein N' [Dehalococcoidia bacterium]
MSYAEVAVGVHTEASRTFSYSIPPELQVRAGHAVQVPFGPRQLPGFVFALTASPGYPETRDIARVVDSEPWLSDTQLKLAEWVSHTYRSSLYAAASLMIPPGFRQKIVATYSITKKSSIAAIGSMTEDQKSVHDYVERGGLVTQNQLEARFGKRSAGVLVGQLVRKRVIHRAWEWLKPKIKPRYVDIALLAVKPRVALVEADRLAGSRATKRAVVLRAIAEAGPAGVAVGHLNSQLGSSRPVIRALQEQGLIELRKQRLDRDPLAHKDYPVTQVPNLTGAQAKAWGEIEVALTGPRRDGRPFLLHGVTGSGKTELYHRALENVVAQGKKGIVLVPEISLTPQTIERFSGRFPGRVAVLHSRLSPGQYFDEWWRIRAGEFDVVIGSRGAIFAPQPELGLIVLDEEHEWTYKQQDPSPRYHARDVAIRLGELTGATVVLGSATPQLESYHLAKNGDYRLLELPDRIVTYADGSTGKAALPRVEVVDMREELKKGNRRVFSNSLFSGITDVLLKDQQAILFLNRRGTATFVQCRDCGYVAKCRRCDTSMTYHVGQQQLRCHHCGSRAASPSHCPDCFSSNIRYMGLGTERLEDEVRKAFPSAVTLRWDRDATQGSNAHEKILGEFLDHRADILIGTQMIAKGLHLPNVTLVGVVNADIGLYSPDFRAGERVFQVLCQVAGRSGRGSVQGKVVIQTYSPANYAVTAAAIQDYEAFYNQELDLRMEAGLPPFSRQARLVFAHTSPATAQRESARVHQILHQRLNEWAFPSTKLVGPAPAPHERIRGRYRWHIIIASPDPALLLNEVPLSEGWAVDIDPVSLL